MKTEILHRRLCLQGLIHLFALLHTAAVPAIAVQGETVRVSVDTSGAEGDGRSYKVSITADGRYVAFSSKSSNLVAGDTNAQNDIFVRDRSTGTTTRVNVKARGNYYSAESNGLSLGPSISDDGLSIAFYSDATNLVVGDTNGERDVFVYAVHETFGNPLWADAVNVGQGWWWLDWFGSIRLDYDPWVYHQEHGWRYTAGTTTDDLYFWDEGMAAICWTADMIYPFVHRFSDGDWLWYDSDTTPARWFVRMSDRVWEQW